jgi:ectoine hydroxylase
MRTDLTSIIEQYDAQGFVLIPDAITDIPDFESLVEANVECVYEKDEKTLRSIYGFQDNDSFKEWLQRNPLIKTLTTKLLPNGVYLHQTKVNIKNQSDSSIWPFHRDYPFWRVFDHFSSNQFINLVVFLDDVTEDSGALEVIPGSHEKFLPREESDGNTDYSLEGSASSDLLFSFNQEEIDYFTSKYGLVKTLGKKGSILLFNPNLIHGSGSSAADFSRKIMILTFNSTDNQPDSPSPRPNYLCNTNYSPIIW